MAKLFQLGHENKKTGQIKDSTPYADVHTSIKGIAVSGFSGATKYTEPKGNDFAKLGEGRYFATAKKKDNNFFGHSKVNKQNIVKNPPKQVPQLGKDGFYSNVKNRTGQL